MFYRLFLIFLLQAIAPGKASAQDSIAWLRGRSKQLLESAPDSAIRYLNKGLYHSQRIDDAGSEAWFSLQKGSIFLNLKDSLRAGEYFNRSLKLYQQISFEEGEALSRRYLGQALADPSQLAAAQSYFEENNDSLNLVRVLFERARLAARHNDFEGAMKYATRATAYARQLSEESLWGEGLLQLASLKLAASNYGAIDSLAALLPASADESQKSGMAVYQAKALLALEQSASAVTLLSHVLEKPQGDQYWQIQALEMLAGIHESAALFPMALRYLEAADSLREMVRNSSQENRVKLLEGEYHNSLKTEQINRLNTALRQDWYQKLLLSGILVVAALFAVIIYRLQRQRLKGKKELLKHNRMQAEVSQKLAQTTLARKQLEEEVLKRELEERKSDLSQFACSFVHHKDVLKQLQARIDRLKRSTADASRRGSIAELSMSLLQLAQRDLPRKHLLDKAFELDDEVYFNLRERFPQLSDQDLELLVFILSGTKSAEIAAIYNIEQASLMTRRYRLRKKLGINKGEDLHDFVERKLAEDVQA